MQYSSSNANDATYANYTTGYLTYKPAIALTPSTTELTAGDVTVTVQYLPYLTGNKTITCTGTSGVDYVINGTESITVKTNNQTITVTAQDASGKTYTNELKITNIDRDKPTVTLGTNSNTTWSKTGSVTVKIKDTGSGLASGASIKYGWSTSNTTAPSSYTTASLSYTAGTTTDVTFTAEASGLTGKYYLWVVPTTLKDVAGNSQTANAISTGMFYFDNTGPSAPTITGGSTTYATSRTISVSTAATDSHVGTVSYYEYYSTSSSTVPTASTSGTKTTTSTTSQTFASNMAAYYVYFRGVDSLGNKGTWSSAQRLYIDVNNPTVSAKNSSVTITAGDSYAMSSYFTTSANGNAGISSTVYKIGSTSYTNTSSLAAGTYTVTCTVTKVGGKTASASMTLTVKSAVPSGSFTNIGGASTGATTMKIPEGITNVKISVPTGETYILTCTPGKSYSTQFQGRRLPTGAQMVGLVVGSWGSALWNASLSGTTKIEWSPEINKLEATGTID